jgi:nicotinate-nucleotide pyrophosphorylase (carboxylating)
MANDFHQTEWDALVEDECRRLVRAAVLEDLDRGQDWTTLALVPMEAMGKAAIVARQAGVIAGLPTVEIILDEMDPRLRFELHRRSERSVSDGDVVEPGSQLGILTGPARSLLTAERLILNFFGRLSGIATQTRRFVELVAGTKARVYDTRKTTPGWRRLEKYAVRQGGGHNHRTGLFDAILIKDNHLALGNIATGDTHFSPAEAVRRARQFIVENFPADDPRRGMLVEVEVDSLDQCQHVLAAQPDIVLLDNMSLDQLRAAVEMRNRLAPQVELEASGGVSLATIGEIARTGVDRISAGALTHSAVSLDVALDWL